MGSVAVRSRTRLLRSKARFERRLMVPAGALASTSALMVLETSMDSKLPSAAISKESARAVVALLASAAAIGRPSMVTEV
jgi:hypothetical protein